MKMWYSFCQIIFIIIALVIVGVIAFFLAKLIFWLSIISIPILILIFIYNAITIISADPPNKGIWVFFGKRQKVLLKEGWHFLPFYPIVFDAISIRVTKINQDLPNQVVRTPDLAEVSVSISVTWIPGGPDNIDEKDQASAFIQFLNSGEEEGVKNILQDIINDRLRGWAISEEEGPSDWQELLGARDDAITVLLKAILGEDLSSIPSSVPTPVLLKYWDVPPKRPLKKEMSKWGKRTRKGSEWQRLEEELAKLSDQERENLKMKIEERRNLIKMARQGNGFFYKKPLGITINRFTIDNAAPLGKTAEAAELKAKEQHERAAEKTEIEGIMDRIRDLKDLGFSLEQALEIVQSERGKITKSVSESKLNISSETRAMIEKVFPDLAKLLKKTT